MLGEHNLSWEREQNARKERIGEDEAWALLAPLASVRVAKGKQVLSFQPAAADRAEVLAAVMGPTGNLRAPALLTGDTLWVGYNEALYQELVAGLRE